MSNENAPQWSPVPPLENYQHARGQRNRASVRTTEGKNKKVPALPYEYWCKPCGNVVRLVVMTTRNVREAIEPHRYADFRRRQAIRDGWFPWHYNDANAFAPHISRGMGTEAWEKWRHEEQLRRWAEHKKRAAQYGAVYQEDELRRAAQAKEQLSGAFADLVEMIRADGVKLKASVQETLPRKDK